VGGDWQKPFGEGEYDKKGGGKGYVNKKEEVGNERKIRKLK
jgi:hypothetical protein